MLDESNGGFDAFLRYSVGAASLLSVSNLFGRPLPVEREHLELQLHRRRGGQEAGLGVTRLVAHRARNGKLLPLYDKRTAKLRGRADLDISLDAKRPLEYWNLFVNRRHKQNLWRRINSRPEFQIRRR